MRKLSKHRCVYRSRKKTRKIDSGNCPSGISVYSCSNEGVESEECVIHLENGKRRETVVESGLPVCISCPIRSHPPLDSPAEPEPDPKPCDPNAHLCTDWIRGQIKRGKPTSYFIIGES